MTLVTHCIGTASWNTILKERENEGWKWWEGKEEDVSSYWITLRKLEDIVNWKRKHYIALPGELALEEAVDLSQDKTTEWMTNGRRQQTNSREYLHFT